MINYFKFICKQLGHLQPWSYWLFFFSLGFQLSLLVTNPITLISIVSFIGTTSGVLCAISITACRSVNGWLGILSGICFMMIAYASKNYLTIGEQLGYIVTLDIPVLLSVDWNQGVAKKVRHLNLTNWFLTLLTTLAIWGISSYGITFIDDPRPVTDGFVFAVSLIGGILTWARYSENFIFWSLVGMFQIVLWGMTAYQGDASIAMLINSFVYLTNDICGFTISPWFNKKTRNKVVAEDKVLSDS